MNSSSSNPYLGSVASITAFIGSTASALACTFAMLMFLLYLPSGRWNIRVKLVMCLLTADFISSCNNTVSSVLFYLRGNLSPGLGCTVNGIMGQLFTQASDLSVLVIALVTFLVISCETESEGDCVLARLEKHSSWIIAFIWFYPSCTAMANLALVGYSPVGNWCWIAPEPNPESWISRIVLTHGLRFLIFLFILLSSTYLAILLRSRNQMHQRVIMGHEHLRHHHQHQQPVQDIITTSEATQRRLVSTPSSTHPSEEGWVESLYSPRTSLILHLPQPSHFNTHRAGYISCLRDGMQNTDIEERESFPSFPLSPTPSSHRDRVRREHEALLSYPTLSPTQRSLDSWGTGTKNHPASSPQRFPCKEDPCLDESHLRFPDISAFTSAGLLAKSIRNRVISSATFRLLALPAVFLIFWLPGMISRLLEWILGAEVLPPCMVCVSLSQYMGLANAIICLWNLYIIIY